MQRFQKEALAACPERDEVVFSLGRKCSIAEWAAFVNYDVSDGLTIRHSRDADSGFRTAGCGSATAGV
jgi:hypothetical protein